ncbi:MAG: prepilin-type N-terminal cleavage/methylation domain-containing protein [Kiritimatiellia bacterium]
MDRRFFEHANASRHCLLRGFSAAFTLIEVMLAIGILAMVVTVSSLVLGVGVSFWKTVTEMGEEIQNGDAILEQVVMGLRSAYYPTGEAPTYEYGFQFKDDGEEENAKDEISWVKLGGSLVGEDTPWAGAAHRVKLRVQDTDENEGPGLYVYAWRIVGQDKDFDPDEDVEPVLLSDQVVAMDCRFQDPTKAVNVGEEYEWVDEWVASNRIPEHILLTLYLKPQGSKKEPDVFQRMVDFPLSELSWNPNVVSGGTGKGSQSGNRKGGATGGGGTSGGGGVTPGGGSGGGGRKPVIIGGGSSGGSGNRGTPSGGSSGGSGNRGQRPPASGTSGGWGGGSGGGGFTIGVGGKP